MKLSTELLEQLCDTEVDHSELELFKSLVNTQTV